jgi:hypothetical protein
VYVTSAVQFDPPPLGKQLVAVMDPKLPCVGAAAIANVRDGLSTSEADNVMVKAVSSAVVWLCELLTGASLTAVTVRVTVAAGEVSNPSLVVNVKLSGPL